MELCRGGRRSTTGGSQRENSGDKHRLRRQHRQREGLGDDGGHFHHRHIGHDRDMPGARGAFVRAVQPTRIVVVVDHPEHDRHAQVEQTNDSGCDALLHEARLTVAGDRRKVKRAGRSGWEPVGTWCPPVMKRKVVSTQRMNELRTTRWSLSLRPRQPGRQSFSKSWRPTCNPPRLVYFPRVAGDGMEDGACKSALLV